MATAGLVVFTAACLLSLTAAQQPVIAGGCPPVVSQKNFNASRYLGDWYEIFVFPNRFEAGKCIRARYSLKQNGRIEVFNRYIENGTEVKAIGEAYVPDLSKPAQLAVRFYDGAPYAPYWVVDTDYTTYSLIFSCESILGLFHMEFAWILSRSMSLDTAITDRLMKELAGFGVKVNKFVKTDQQNCIP